LGLKISKIAQPESDELLLTLKGNSGQHRLLLSASASLPFAYLTEDNKTAPLTAPTFCMVLRKHIANGKITRIYQPGLERIIHFEMEHLNELGDLCKKELIIELMGKHSNIILCDGEGRIIDSIKHVSSMMSSVREVLPGRPYFIAATQGEKADPLTATKESVYERVRVQPVSVTKAIYGSFTGISPLLANEIAYRAGIDGDVPVASLTDNQILHLANHFCWFMDEVKENHFSPVIIRKDREPIEFSSVPLQEYKDYETETYDSISKVLEVYYAEKNTYTRIRQKSVELRKLVNTALERNIKKYDLQQKQLKDSAKKDTYKLYGEMIQAYGYGLEEGTKELLAENYYDNNKIIKVPLDPTISPMDNAKKYFDKYGKLKRTSEALTELIKETKAEIDHLESIQNSLDIALSADDLVQIRQELAEYGFIKKNRSAKKEKIKSKPFHYRSTDGYDIYVGKNNYQNDELTFKVATGNDWWFHAKGIPGSHVIVKSNNEELPDRVFEEAGKLAGFYSKGRDNEKIEIDYLQKKNVKKPNGSAPGFVVYYTNYSMTVHPDIRDIELVEE
jgi:predicted ribosome quality control (RQC) complex YloA/Tae2 family protein